jgi:hypothetical protein
MQQQRQEQQRPTKAGGPESRTSMIRVVQLRDAIDRAREEINDPRVFDEVMQQSMIRFERACAEASFPAIVDKREVVAACDTFIEGVVGLLFARAAGAKALPFKLRAAKREIDRAALLAHTAYDDLNTIVKKAMETAAASDRAYAALREATPSGAKSTIDQAEQSAALTQEEARFAFLDENPSETHRRLKFTSPRTTVSRHGITTSSSSPDFVYVVSTMPRKAHRYVKNASV